MKPRLIEIRQGVLNRNDEVAAGLRERFTRNRVFVTNLVSSPGAGKTTFLQETMRRLIERGARVAALVGDIATDNDARRLAQTGAPVKQIETAGNCHLEADQIERFLEGWDLDALDYLFIENVGNLICPSSYDLGEALRVVLLSTTEGEDKPLKYPPMFFSSDVAVLTKIDIAEAVEFNRTAAFDSIMHVHPGMPVLEVSAKTGAGMDAWLDFLTDYRTAQINEARQEVR
ncbi:MAG: hydrogenase nickel incorporation protein HypB [Anaerolineae bacterium]